jgi:hypothetical protein
MLLPRWGWEWFLATIIIRIQSRLFSGNVVGSSKRFGPKKGLTIKKCKGLPHFGSLKIQDKPCPYARPERALATAQGTAL